MKRIAKFEKVSFEQFKKDCADACPQLAEDNIKEIYDGIKLPKRATTGSAGYDFFAPFQIVLQPGCTMKWSWIQVSYAAKQHRRYYRRRFFSFR